MTSLEGRVIRRRKALEPAGGRAQRAVGLVGAGPPPRLPRRLRHRAGGWSSTSWPGPAPAAGPTTAGSATPGSTPGSRSTGRAPPDPRTRPTRARRGSSPTASPRLTAGPGSSRWTTTGRQDDVRPDAPVYLVTGRVLQHYQSGAQTRRVPELAAAVPGPFVELHPLLAQRLGIDDGGGVVLTGRRGRVTTTARLTDAIRPDTLFMPFHWGGAGSVNLLTNDATDPVSGMPEFKVCAVDVRPASLSPQPDWSQRMTRVVVVGNGMVGSRFVEDLLAEDRAGRFSITVLGAEDCEPYNRVLLSEVVAGTLRPCLAHPSHADRSPPERPPWRRRCRGSTGRTGSSSLPTAADTATTCVVLATGAAARVPPLPGLGTDARRPAPRGAPAAHHRRRPGDRRGHPQRPPRGRPRRGRAGPGGGLRAGRRGVRVTVVHPAPALMERQLDGEASRVVEAGDGQPRHRPPGRRRRRGGPAAREVAPRCAPRPTGRSSTPSCWCSPPAPWPARGWRRAPG